MFLATGVEIALGILAGLSIVASILFRPKVKSPIQDQQPNTLASRGSYIPLIVGRRRTGSVFGWEGKLRSKKSGGGKGKGVGRSPGSRSYFQSGVHWLCVGPARGIYRIWRDGEVAFDGALTPGSHPSGSTVDLENGGSFRIYWGEQSQPIDPLLSLPVSQGGMGVASNFPFVCYLVWDEVELGPLTRWAVWDYEVDVAPNAPNVASTSPDIAHGVNPFHVLDQVITAPFPWGLGRDSDLIDVPSFEAAAELSLGELLATNLAARDGETAEALATAILTDTGCAAPSIEGRMTIVPVREPNGEQRLLDRDVVMNPRPEIKGRPGRLLKDQAVFVFDDKDLNYRDQSFVEGEDGVSSQGTTSRSSETVRIEVATDTDTAARIADRRGQERLAKNVAFRVIANRQARTLYPGLPAYVNGIAPSLRLMSVKPDVYSGRVELELVADHYGLPAAFGGSGPTFGGIPQEPDVGPDLVAIPIEVPGDIPGVIPGGPGPNPGGGNLVPIAVPRVRNSDEVAGAEIYVSPDDSTYYLLGIDRNEGAGGELVGSLPASASEIESGPLFAPLGPDLGTVINLGGDTASWRNGRQALVIGAEIIFIRSVEAIAADSYRLHGLIRGQFGTTAAAHAAGDRFVIVQVDQAIAWKDPLFERGRTIYFKTRPFGGGTSVPLTSIPSVTYTVPTP